MTTTLERESESGKLSARKGLYDNNFFKQTLNHPSSTRAKKTRQKIPTKYNIMITSYQAHMAEWILCTFFDGALVTSGCRIKSRFSFLPSFFSQLWNAISWKSEKDFHPIFISSMLPVTFFPAMLQKFWFNRSFVQAFEVDWKLKNESLQSFLKSLEEFKFSLRRNFVLTYFMEFFLTFEQWGCWYHAA